MVKFHLKNKTILLISPQKWSKMHVSKHHYAIELARKGNKVYFLNPMNKGFGYNISPIPDHDNLFLLNLNYSFAFHFHSWFLFHLFIRIILLYISKKNKIKFDIIWNFSHQMFSNYRFFNYAFKIYQPMDAIDYSFDKTVAKNSDIIISISDPIIQKFSQINRPKLLINHGLSNLFEKQARLNLEHYNYFRPEKPKIGFTGNLLFYGLDFESYKSVISENQDCLFIFWGPYKLNNTAYRGNRLKEEVDNFIGFLQNQNNVNLKGIVSQDILLNEMQDIDIFTAFYMENNHVNKSANSHKLLEYLSTGKVIVTNYISMYKKHSDIIRMSQANQNNKIPAIFKDTLNNLEFYNNIEKSKERISFALNNTYSNQISIIEDHINNYYFKS